MSKKLKIQFWKAEKALAMQVLEQKGLPRYKEEGKALIRHHPALYEYDIVLRGRSEWDNLRIPSIGFNTNAERDAYLQKGVNAITDELFTGEGELKVGEMCEVKYDESSSWERRKLIAILPSQYKKRFITETEDNPTEHFGWTYARPISKRIEPTIEESGNIVTYTWEEK